MKGIQNTTTENFSTRIGNGKKYIVPKFQRDYSWDTQQWDDLWQDIAQMTENSEDHYMGYLVLQTSDNKEFLIIDGQQRFTTITLIILAAIKSIQKLVDKGEDVEDNKQRMTNLINTYIGTEDPVSLDYDNILVLNRNNDGYYKDYIVKLGELKLRNTSATEKLMKRGFEFYESVLNNRYKTGKEYAAFIVKLVDNLFFTTITVNDDMNAFRVFETLNARGVQLSSSDLLKNYLFSLVDNTSNHTGRIESLEEKWTKLTLNIKAEKLPEFIRYYWNAKNRLVRANDLFKTIRKDVSQDTQVFSLINEMLEYSEVYMALRDENDDLWEQDDEIKENVHLLNLFNLKQPYSLLMSAKRNLPIDRFKKVLNSVIIVCFRFSVICGKNPNDIERTFNELAISIYRDKKFDISMFSKIYVLDNEFVGIFNTRSFSINSRNTKVIRYILSKIDRFSGTQINANIYDDNNSIEHILPQNPNEDWEIDEDKVERLSGRLGNLCLLEKKLNNSIENLNFDTKKTFLAKSVFKCTSIIATEYSNWNENSINSRQAKMGKCAKSIWKIDI